MKPHVVSGREVVSTSGRFFGHAATVIAGFVLMVIGLALGVTMVLLPVGLVVGLAGVLIFLAGIFARLNDEKRKS